MYKYEFGNMSEGIVLSAYLRAGFTVSLPFGTGASYDLVVDAGPRLLEIQVKTAWISKGCVLYKSQRRQPGTGLTRRPYRNGEVDYFVAYCPTNGSLYVVPAKNHGVEGRLRLSPVKNGQMKLVKWAVDFTWERHIEELRSWYAWQESNLRPPVPETGALSTELQARQKDYYIGETATQKAP
jgi:PD-(D/E)XK endonuclease